MLKQLNAAIEYIESNLCTGFDLDVAAGIACITSDSFIRFFSYMTGMTLTEYVRCRRLTLAAQDLQYSNEPIIDIALKYGYETATTFSRAFVKQHGITPTVYRKEGGSIKIYPPASFHIIIKGAKAMNFRIIELNDTEIFGISKPYDGDDNDEREELRRIMWSDRIDNIPEQICEGKFDWPENYAFDGIWYGVWQDGRYMIGRESEYVKKTQLERKVIPAGTYAVFTSESGGLAGVEIPKLFNLIFDSLLPTSEYKLRDDIVIEILHLWTRREQRKENRYYEVWLPVVKK